VTDGHLAPTRGKSTTLRAVRVGSGTIVAARGFPYASAPARITVQWAALGSIAIRTAPRNGGRPVGAERLEMGQALELWAAGYDAGGTHVGDVPVTWTGTGVLRGQLHPTTGVRTTLNPTAAGTGMVNAADGWGHTAITGNIQVSGVTPWTRIRRFGGAVGSFFSEMLWTILSFGLLLALVPLLIPGVYLALEGALQPIASLRVAGFVGALCLPVIVFFMYSLRPALYRYDQTRQFSKRPGRSLAIWALTLFSCAILLVFLLAFVWTSKDSIIGPPGVGQEYLQSKLAYGSLPHLLLKMTMTAVLPFSLVFIAASAGMMSARDYGKRLARKGQTPDYLDTDKLRDKVLEAAREQCGLGGSPNVTTLERTPGGGIRLVIRDRKAPTKQDGLTVVEEQMWTVQADHAGRIIRIEPGSPLLLEIKKRGEPAAGA